MRAAIIRSPGRESATPRTISRDADSRPGKRGARQPKIGAEEITESSRLCEHLFSHEKEALDLALRADPLSGDRRCRCVRRRMVFDDRRGKPRVGPGPRRSSKQPVYYIAKWDRRLLGQALRVAGPLRFVGAGCHARRV